MAVTQSPLREMHHLVETVELSRVDIMLVNDQWIEVSPAGEINGSRGRSTCPDKHTHANQKFCY